jgi:isoleucyl-tRNA synthetase
MNGGLYQGAHPVMWSVVEQTALADAEVEYEDHTSTTIIVRFPILRAADPRLAGASALIWTTTPWTIPGNRAIAYSPELTYVLVRVSEVGEGSLAQVGERLLMAEDLVGSVMQQAKITGFEAEQLGADALDGAVAAHPWRDQGYAFEVPLLPGTHVTAEQGTGLVHIAPGHGPEDFELGQRFGIEVPKTVAGDGLFNPAVPLFAGQHVFKADPQVVAALKDAGKLLASGKLTHSYPHSWRSKAPLIYRATPQWFISMEANGLREKALAAIEATRWVPPQGKHRIGAMIEQRPDWCISRQRSWGVPLAVFVDRRTGEPLRDEAVNARIAESFEQEGGDAWFASPPERFLGNGHNPADFEQIRDVIEVWFDSGSTHAFVLEKRPDLKWPASLYLEGSDQHRGWFHSSLLESCGTRGRAPYESVLTHGFVLDEQGRKMSKSLGNVVAPQKVTNDMGADILRLWVVSSDYSEDLRIGPEILKYQADLYRRLRNTLRYLLGALDGFTPAERVEPADMPELERWVLHRMAEMDEILRAGIADYQFHAIYAAIHNFCAVDLSAFYFDIRKDSLYCDPPASLRRRAARSVMALLLDSLTLWLAPVLCFTAEEAWSLRPGASGDEADSVHRRLFPAAEKGWRNEDLAGKWQRLRELRRVVTGAIELARADKVIGASLQAAPTLYLGPEDRALAESIDMAELCITSGLTVAAIEAAPADAFRVEEVKEVAVAFGKAVHQRCERCWRMLAEVGQQSDPLLCLRCEQALQSVVVHQ